MRAWLFGFVLLAAMLAASPHAFAQEVSPAPESSPSPASTSSPAPSSPSSAPSSPSAPTPSPSALVPVGVVPTQVTVTLGGVVSPAFAQTRISTEISRAAQLQAGASAVAGGVTIAAPLHPGDSVEALATVTIAGAGFGTVTGTTAVHLAVESLDQLDPAFLFYSDDPERLSASADGVLYRNTIDRARSARVYAYHVSDAPGRTIYLTLSSTAAAQVQILGYAAGPATAFAFVGHVSTLRYLLEHATQESAVVALAADIPYAQQLGYRALGPGELIAAIYDLRVLSGGPVDVAVVSVPSNGVVTQLLTGSELPGDGHGRRGDFSLVNVPPLALTYAAGAPDPAPVSVGVPTVPNLRPGGRALGGDYGVLRPVALSLSNAQATPQTIYFYEQAAGGTATTSIWFTGDPAPIEIPCVKDQTSRYLVKALTLDAGETRVVTGEYMTDGSSSFPLEFGLTADAPSPPPGPYSPDACNPRPSPAPSPLPSETPDAGGSAAPLPEPSTSASNLPQ